MMWGAAFTALHFCPGNVKIGDLGLGKMLSNTTAFATSLVGTPLYFSPEICEGRHYDAKSDMWALGYACPPPPSPPMPCSRS